MVFWSAVIASGERIALVVRDETRFQRLVKDTQDLVGLIIEELLRKSAAKFEDLLETLKKEYPSWLSGKIVDSLRKSNFREI